MPSARLFAQSCAVATLLLLPGHLLAQACISSPNFTGQNSVTVGAGFEEGATSFGANANFNLQAPVGLQVGVASTKLDNLDDRINGVNGALHYQIPGSGFEACPGLGVGYATWSTRFDGVNVSVSEVSLPISGNIGWRIGTEGVALVPSLGAGLVFSQLRYSASGGGESFQETESDNYFFGAARTAVDFDPFFVATSISKSSLEDSKVLFQIGVGVKF
jgi:hypothetical protein